MADEIKSNNNHDGENWELSSEEEDEEMPVAVNADDDDDSDSVSGGEDEEMDSSKENGMCEDSEGTVKKVYLPSRSMNEDDGPLECDESAYVFYRQATTVAPCLSFDVIKDNLGDDRADKFPLTMSIVCGTQAERSRDNSLIVMKMSNINKTKQPDSDEDEESDSDSEDDIPSLSCGLLKHSGCVNRIRFTSIGGKPLAATWSDHGRVFLWDLTSSLRAVDSHHAPGNHTRNIDDVSPVFSFSGHLTEGYAMDWSPLIPGALATGDNKKNIHLWKPLEGGSWHVEQKALSAHTASVEDIQWSPNENNVLASCSVDKTIRVWDTRAPANKSCVLTTENAHDSDVNVINWNKHEPFILSGGDDGKIKVWDIRRFPKGSPLCTFKHHVASVTSVEWHPTDPTVFAASGADDQVTLWDLAVEADLEQEGSKGATQEELDLPPQVLFIHQGQKEIKEIHWHPQMPGVLISTAQTGFDIFRTLSV